MSVFYSIDPGLAGTGWARWLDRRCPDAVGVLYLSAETGDDLPVRAEDLARKMRTILDEGGHLHRKTIVYLEMPQQMTNVRGLAAQGGAVYKLAFFVGYLARALHPCEVHVVTPSEWKGQLPKDVVQRRIERYLSPEVCRALNLRTHAWDAVGLGLWATGVWR